MKVRNTKENRARLALEMLDQMGDEEIASELQERLEEEYKEDKTFKRDWERVIWAKSNTDWIVTLGASAQVTARVRVMAETAGEACELALKPNNFTNWQYQGCPTATKVLDVCPDED